MSRVPIDAMHDGTNRTMAVFASRTIEQEGEYLKQRARSSETAATLPRSGVTSIVAGCVTDARFCCSGWGRGSSMERP